MTEPPPPLSDRFLRAVALASEIHGAQRRLGTEIPDQVWYYTELLRIFATHREGPLLEDLRRAVAELAELMAADPSTVATTDHGLRPPVAR
jgi:hypothetical protein